MACGGEDGDQHDVLPGRGVAGLGSVAPQATQLAGAVCGCQQCRPTLHQLLLVGPLHQLLLLGPLHQLLLVGLMACFISYMCVVMFYFFVLSIYFKAVNFGGFTYNLDQ